MKDKKLKILSLNRDDLNGDWIRKFNLSSLTNVSMAGERCDIPTY